MLHQVQTWCAMCTDACRKGSRVQSRVLYIQLSNSFLIGRKPTVNARNQSQ